MSGLSNSTMIKFYKQNQWPAKEEVKAISIFNATVVHCRCGCGEWSLFIIVLGLGYIVTYNKNKSK